MKHRITMTVVVEYEIDPANYPGCTTDEERLAIDLEIAEDDIFAFMDSDKMSFDVTGETLKTEL